MSIFLLIRYRSERIGLLTLLYWLVYALPFVHIVSYLWFDFEQQAPLTLWGLSVNPYMLDERIIELTAMIGAVGSLGFALGVALSKNKIIHENNLRVGGHQLATLPTFIWLMWVFFGVALSWAAAPRETLTTAAYTASMSALQHVNFSSAWMVSYVLLIFALCDSILDRNKIRSLFKRRVIWGAIIFVVVFLQFMRGDRESVTLIIACLLVNFYWASPASWGRRLKLPWIKMALVGFVLVVVMMILGEVRHTLVGIEDIGGIISRLDEYAKSERFSAFNLINGTWSAVLLTPLSAAGDYVHGLLSLNYGQDYLNLLLSLPPGFVADAVGYVRPIDSLSSPAREIRYGLGGIHSSVLPFMNFRMIGVFLFPVIWVYIITRIEKRVLMQKNVTSLSLVCVLAMASPHWLWYGDKYGINALIIWFMLMLLYRVILYFIRQLNSAIINHSEI